MKSVTELVLDVQDRASIPLNDDDRWSTDAVVRAFNSVITEQVSPKLIGLGSDFQIIRRIYPLQSGGVVNYPTLVIPLPKRAYGRAIREIKFIAAGATLDRKNEINVTQTSLAEFDAFQNMNWASGSWSSPMVYISGDAIHLLGDPATYTGNLVVYYHLEISEIVNKTSELAEITNITFNSGTGVTTFVAAAGSEWQTFMPNPSTKLVDIYRKPTGTILRPDVTLSRISGTSYTTSELTANEVAELKAYQEGNFPVTVQSLDLLLLPAGQSQFSTIPYEFDSILVLETCSRILESLGDDQGLATVQAMLTKAYDSVAVSMGSRLSAQRKKVTDPRRLSTFQSSLRGRIRGGNYTI